jgi:divalent metal cation (Fe/Co/Zn/Cd) transporter
VREAHEAVDALERAVRREAPELTRIIGHVEPLQSED